MIRKTDLALVVALRDSLAELLPDNYIIDDRIAIESTSPNSMVIKCRERDFICYVRLTNKGISILLPNSLESVEKNYTQMLKTVEFDYANPSFSIEKLAKVIMGEKDANEEGSEG